MTPEQFRAALAALNLSQMGAARLLGVDGRTCRRWALGERDVPAPAVRFLQYLIASGTTPETVMQALHQHAGDLEDGSD